MIKKKRIVGIALEDLKTYKRFEHLKLDFIKIISSPIAQNMKLINYILKK